MDVTKAELDGPFADERALLQPRPATYVWSRTGFCTSGKSDGRRQRIGRRSRRSVKVIQQKLDRLDGAFLLARSIDATSYERQRDRLREELTFARIDTTPRPWTNSTHGASWRSQNTFCRAPGPLVEASLDYRQRLQLLFFPDGIAYDGVRFNRIAATTRLLNYLARPSVLMKRW